MYHYLKNACTANILVQESIPGPLFKNTGRDEINPPQVPGCHDC
jgi:hypothetical protein